MLFDFTHFSSIFCDGPAGEGLYLLWGPGGTKKCVKNCLHDHPQKQFYFGPGESKGLHIKQIFSCQYLMPMVLQQLRELPTLAILFLLHELPKVCGPFFVALAVHATVARPLAYRGCHCTICQWIRGRVIAKSAGSG
jgi:hypothetical protein